MKEDFWFWLPNNTSQFSFCSAWNHIKNKYTELNRTSIIQDSCYAPKMSTCSLLAKFNKLNTKDRVSRWNNSIDQSCVLCLNHNEDRNHLFFICSHSRQMLEDIMQKLNIRIGNDFDISQILEIFCQNQYNNPICNHLKNIAFNSLIWNIQCDRNLGCLEVSNYQPKSELCL